MTTQQTQHTPNMSQTSGVGKRKPPAVKRRADKRRAKRLASGMDILPPLPLNSQLICQSAVHLANIANAIKNKTRKQSQRWLRYTYNHSHRDWEDNEAWHSAVRYVAHEGKGKANFQVLPLLGVSWLARLDQERKEARLAAGVGEREYVEDWFGDQVDDEESDTEESDDGDKDDGDKDDGDKDDGDKDDEDKDDGNKDDGGVPVVAGRIMLSPEVEEEKDRIA